MITFLSSPKPFIGETKHIQVNAIKSWLAIGKDVEVILYGDSEGAEEAATVLGITYIRDIETSESGTPVFNSIVKHAELHGRYDMQVYINCDILLTEEFYKTMLSIHMPEFLMVGQRIDLAEGTTIDVVSETWQAELSQLYHNKVIALHPPWGSDYFAFRRGLWADLKPLYIGRGGYDNALIAYCIRRSVPVIDATLSALAIHQYHGYNHVAGGRDTVFMGAEAQSNLAAVGSSCRPVPCDASYMIRNGQIYRSYARNNWIRAFQIYVRLRLSMDLLGKAVWLVEILMNKVHISRPMDVSLHSVLSAVCKDNQSAFDDA